MWEVEFAEIAEDCVFRVHIDCEGPDHVSVVFELVLRFFNEAQIFDIIGTI